MLYDLELRKKQKAASLFHANLERVLYINNQRESTASSPCSDTASSPAEGATVSSLAKGATTSSPAEGAKVSREAKKLHILQHSKALLTKMQENTHIHKTGNFSRVLTDKRE